MTAITAAERIMMNWKTIYVVGRDGFAEEVMKALNRSDVEVMSGYNSDNVTNTHELFWVRENLDMAKFKRAIGAKLVLKYRLHFFTELEQFVETLNNSEFTEDELKRMQEMRRMSSAA